MKDRCDIPFEPKHRFSTQNNILSGITLSAWLQLLWERKHGVDFKTYWFRIIFITLMAILNSTLALFEKLFYGRSVRECQLKEDPVFILGHPRTGTTLLLNLFSLDPNLTAPTTLQAGFPSAFLLVEPFKHLLSGVISSTRPMDNMALSLDSPQEDELGTNVLTAGLSPVMPICFMAIEPEFRKYFSMEECSQKEKRRYIDSFLYLIKKITFASKSKKRLVLKSPTHTGKVKLLLSLFPNAKFVYIHRNPYKVFQSALNMADKTYWYNYVKMPSKNQLLDFIVNQYQTLFQNYIEDRPLIPKGNLFELSFAQLTNDGVGMMEEIYAHFGWTHFDSEVKDAIANHLNALKGYKKNTFENLTQDQKEYVQRVWGDSFREFGYEF